MTAENRKIPTSLILFLLPILIAILLYALLNPSSHAEGSIKLLYTSEVWGKLDPCG